QIIVYLHLAAVKRNARGIAELLSFGFARGAFGARDLVARFVLRLVPDDRILRNAQHRAVQQAVPGERKCVDLYFRLLPWTDETDVAVRYHRLDFEPALGGHHDQQGLRRGDNPPHSVNGNLLPPPPNPP